MQNLLSVGLALAVAVAAGSSTTVFPDAAGDEAVKLLSEYIRVNTTNPPGNETLGAEHLAKVFKANGIESQIFETDKGRSCLYARLKGTGNKRPLILLNHIDVVPAQASDWSHDPFSGDIVDGEIWGRGALDMKGMAIAELESMLLLKRAGKPLQRDVIFLATPDEEVGGHAGAAWFVKNHPELVRDAEFLLNEGYFIEQDETGKPKMWGVDVAEKSVLWLKLTARGDAGHGSMPYPETAPNKLIRALSHLTNDPPTKLDRLHAAMEKNTVSLTVLKSGYKTNVIPAEAIAELDCRLLPGVTEKVFVEEIKKRIEDPSIDVSILDWVHAEASPKDTELMTAIKAVANEEQPGVPVTPIVVPWFTDSHWFRDFGTIAYGFEPMEVDAAHLATMHGKNERVPVKNFKDGVRRLHKIVSRLVY